MRKTQRKPGRLTDRDRDYWADFQERYRLKKDGVVGHQTTGQVQQLEATLHTDKPEGEDRSWEAPLVFFSIGFLVSMMVDYIITSLS